MLLEAIEFKMRIDAVPKSQIRQSNGQCTMRQQLLGS